MYIHTYTYIQIALYIQRFILENMGNKKVGELLNRNIIFYSYNMYRIKNK